MVVHSDASVLYPTHDVVDARLSHNHFAANRGRNELAIDDPTFLLKEKIGARETEEIKAGHLRLFRELALDSLSRLFLCDEFVFVSVSLRGVIGHGRGARLRANIDSFDFR